MPHVSVSHRQYYGTVVGSGHCVALVQGTTHVGHTSTWQPGKLARGSGCVRGTLIATFDADGTYGNNTDGSSHAAIFLAEQPDGLLVCDQWSGQVVHERVLSFRNGEGDACNDGDAFRIIET